MTMTAAGVAKLIEECGELQQVLGKLLAWWELDEPHWDGSILRVRLIEEMGDVQAAIMFVAEQLGLDINAIDERWAAKRALFGTWQEQIDNNDHGIDAAAAGSPELTKALDHLRCRWGLFGEDEHHEHLRDIHAAYANMKAGR